MNNKQQFKYYVEDLCMKNNRVFLVTKVLQF